MSERRSAAPVRTGARFTSFALLAAQLTLIAAYLALVVAPFLVHDLHNQPEEQVAGGWYDPKSLWAEPIAPVASTLAMLSFQWFTDTGALLNAWMAD